MRSRNWLPVFAVALALTMLAPLQERTIAQSASGIVISEFRFRGPNGLNDEFVELFNAGTTAIDVSGWMLRASNNNQPPAIATRATLPPNTSINPGCYYLIANTNAGYNGTVAPDLAYSTGIADNGGIGLVNTANVIVDQVGMGTVLTAFGEGTRLAPVTDNIDRGFDRLPGGVLGHVDTNNNAADFAEVKPADPQNSNPSSCLHSSALAVTASVSSPTAEPGQAVTVFGTVVPGTVPASSGIQVRGNFTPLGGPASAVLLDNGVSPDAAANDKIFTATVTVAAGNPLGPQTITLTATDAQTRTATSSATVTVTAPVVIYSPHDIQGSGSVSPFASGTPVIVRGVVTARTAQGFFIQSEPGSEDSDDATSEGLFVRAGAPLPSVAEVVDVSAKVGESVPASDPGSPSVTELYAVAAVTNLGQGTVPAAYVLSAADLSPAGALDQLEHLEGMRVMAPSLTATGGTGGVRDEVQNWSVSDGAFFAVLTGEARPFREPGVERGYPLLPCALAPCHVPEFDGNPERLRVQTGAVEGTAPIDVSTGAVLTQVTGPLGFSARTYTIVTDTQLSAPALAFLAPVPAAPFGQFSVASLHLDRLYDAGDASGNDVVVTPGAYEARLSKASLMIRDMLHTPDMIGVQSVEDLGVLFQLAQRVDADAEAAGQPKPQYLPLLVAGNDPAALNVGFLLKQAGKRVQMESVDQVDAGATFVDPSTSNDALVFDHPPLVVTATAYGPATKLPQPLTVIVNDLLPLDGVGDQGVEGQRLRARRRAQAERLAEYVQGRQINDPNEAIVVLGGFNAYAFNDGYVDTFGTVRGLPALEDQVAAASTDVVSPDLVAADTLIDPQEQYAELSRGNAVGLDHVLVSANLVPQLAGFAYARVNADFPEILRSHADTASRLSDRDPAVAYFTFKPDQVAPVLANVPADLVVEATSAAGASVTFASPSATDNLDAFVGVACAPASGSLFAPGSTEVQCTAQDLAGNAGDASFNVLVRDTTAPVLSLPSNISVEATSSSGKSVSFVATATDIVTPAPLVTCAPASGSTFPIGTTTVSCVAADGTGNTSAGSFTVAVTAPVITAGTNSGHLVGTGNVETASLRVQFAFDVRESTSGNRGSLVVQIREGKGRPDHQFTAEATAAAFSDAPGYTPGRSSAIGADTVVFSGLGNWDGRGGYRFEVTATDRGEPGRGRDTFALNVVAPNGQLVASAAGTLTEGNIQSQR